MRKSRSFLTLFFVALLILFLSGGQDILSVMKAEGTSGDNLSEIQKKAEQGVAEAQFDLGIMYLKGEDLPQNFSEAASGEGCQL